MGILDGIPTAVSLEQSGEKLEDHGAALLDAAVMKLLGGVEKIANDFLDRLEKMLDERTIVASGALSFPKKEA